MSSRATIGCFAMMLTVGSGAYAPAVAQNNGNDNQSCAISIDDDGIFRANPKATVLSSRELGGRPGRATVTATNSRYRISVAAPTGFNLAPAGGNVNTRFEAYMSATGAANFATVPSGVEEKIKRGSTDVEVHFEAERFDGSFPSGQYQATVVLRCE
ncbi:MAG: hypothetical protein AAFR13_05405 [Pseudomonadota bacterium]